MNIFSFSGEDNLEYYLEKLKKYLEEFAEADEVENEITG
jgi:hypothetical protein